MALLRAFQRHSRDAYYNKPLLEPQKESSAPLLRWLNGNEIPALSEKVRYQPRRAFLLTLLETSLWLAVLRTGLVSRSISACVRLIPPAAYDAVHGWDVFTIVVVSVPFPKSFGPRLMCSFASRYMGRLAAHIWYDSRSGLLPSSRADLLSKANNCQRLPRPEMSQRSVAARHALCAAVPQVLLLCARSSLVLTVFSSVAPASFICRLLHCQQFLSIGISHRIFFGCHWVSQYLSAEKWALRGI